jgi:ATP-dependent protease HslVU (ClpYQ) peptidase subunit
MTCIVGVTDRSSVLLGADSASVDDESWRIETVRTPKIFRRAGVLLGFSGGWTVGHRLRSDLVLPLIGRATPTRYVEDELAPEVFELLEDESDWDVLIAARGHLYHLSADGYVQEPRERFLAIGLGAGAARGALLVMSRDESLTLQERAKRALFAAEADSAVVRRPFRYRRA